MAKKKETCPYCGKTFAHLGRHKCKIKERVEGGEDDKTETERRIERMEETKKEIGRALKKEEKMVLNIIAREKELYFDDLIKLSNKKKAELEEILETLALQSKIKVARELIDSSWTKRIQINDEYSEVKIEPIKINKEKKDYIWDIFSRQPCFICPFIEKCNETNLDQFNPHHCNWLGEWIKISLEGKEYTINFDEIQSNLQD